MNKNLELSVIIITFNRFKQLNECLNKISIQSAKPDEVIVIDDGSNDYTKNIVKSFQSKIGNLKYYFQKNKGFASARNLGMKKSSGDIIAFVDDDCKVDKGWIKNIHKAYLENPSAYAIGGKIENGINTPIHWASHILNFSKWINDKKCWIDNIPTANISYRKDKIIGSRFDEKQGLFGYEDSIFNYNLLRGGGKILYEPKISVIHYHNFKDFQTFLNYQKFKGMSFINGGYKIHGTTGRILYHFPIFNLLCPDLISIFINCMRSKHYRLKFFLYFPIIFIGELFKGIETLKD